MYFMWHTQRDRLCGFVIALVVGLAGASPAQVLPITSSGLETQVGAPVILPGGEVQHNITGGTRPGGGANLFHSFGEFEVPTNNIANFLNDAGLPTSNILSRVNGGNPSNIFGTIQTEGFGNANLFLMNPAGIVFGPDASLNVGGDTHFTTADYLKLSDGVQFMALPSAQDSVLGIAPVEAFGFLDSNVSPLSVEGATLSVDEGHALSLVGGDIAIDGSLTVPGGQIGLASVASSGEVVANTFDPSTTVNGDSFANMGDISLLEGAMLDVSDVAAGSVIIRGGKLRITNASIFADTGDSNGATKAIDIQITEDFIITDTLSEPVITARATGIGDAGEVRILAHNIDAISNAVESFALIDTHTSSLGTAGKIDILATGNLHVDGPQTSRLFFLDSGTTGLDGGLGGDVSIVAKDVLLENTRISTGDFVGFSLGEDTAGSGGNFVMRAETIFLTGSRIFTDGFFEGKAGDLTIFAQDFQMQNRSILSLAEFEGGGALTINAQRFLADSSQLEVETVFGRGEGVPWTGITVNAAVVELQNGSTVRSQTVGDGNAGNIRVTARERFTLSDDPNEFGAILRPTGLFTNSTGDQDLGNLGSSGDIIVETGLLEFSGGARFDSTTQSNGSGGDVVITVNEEVSISGSRLDPVLEFDTFGLGSSRPSGIFSRTVGSEFCTGQCGDAGNISISTGSVRVSDGATINSGTTSDGQGGVITVNASGSVSIVGTLGDGTSGGIFSQTTGTDTDSGEGGNITLNAGNSFFLGNGAAVSASSSGPANAGTIQVIAADTIVLDDGTITTEAAQASGGNIQLTADELIRLNDSVIASSVQGDATTAGGDIGLDSNFIILQDSQILAQAVEGQGGNISLVATNAVLADPLSALDASSALGVSGSVDIQAPIQNLSGTLAPLPEETVPVTALYGARCAAGPGGHFSTFVDSKADSLAPAPGTFLASPLLAPSHSTSRVAQPPQSEHPPVILTASIAPLVFGQSGFPTTACP